jgi:hypothetical protein
VKVGHRQALTARNARLIFDQPGVFFYVFDVRPTIGQARSQSLKKPA